jgi:hypothetical protein
MHLGRKHRKAVGTHWRLGGEFSKGAAQIEGEENWRQFSDLWAVSFRSPKRKRRKRGGIVDIGNWPSAATAALPAPNWPANFVNCRGPSGSGVTFVEWCGVNPCFETVLWSDSGQSHKGLSLRQGAVDKVDSNCSFSHRRGHALHITRANIAHSKHARKACFQHV